MHTAFQKQKHDHTCVNKKLPMPSTQNFETFKPSDGSNIYYEDLGHCEYLATFHKTFDIKV